MCIKLMVAKTLQIICIYYFYFVLEKVKQNALYLVKEPGKPKTEF